MNFGNMGTRGKMMQQIQKMQQDLEEMKEEVEKKTVETTAGGGVVRVECNGAMEIVDIEIDPDAVDPDDVDMLRDLIIAAVNEGLREAQDMVNREMEKVTGGMDLPNLPGLMD